MRADQAAGGGGAGEAGRVQGGRAEHGRGPGEGAVPAHHPRQGLRHDQPPPARANLPSMWGYFNSVVWNSRYSHGWVQISLDYCVSKAYLLII